MRRPILLITTIALLLLVRAPMGAQAQSYAFDVFGDYLESLQTQAGAPGMAAAVVGDSGILWERAYGKQDVARNIATRTDTPFHADGLTQLMTASMVLGCVDQHRLSLDDRVSTFRPNSTEPNATIRQLLSHTSGSPAVFAYKPERLEPLWYAVRQCTGDSYRETLGGLFHRMAMFDSVPGPDATRLVPPAEGIPDAADSARYAGVLARLATPYAVDARGRATPSQYSATTLTPSSGLISTVRDFARFDMALRQGALMSADTLAAAWRPPVGADGLPLPHGLGWFVQSYGGETVVWQFGLGDDASSSLVMTLPARKITVILMANSDRLVKPASLASGDLTVSPFGKLFLSFFVR